MRALGFDPGSASPGWAAIEVERLGHAVALGCGILDRRGAAGEDLRVEEAVELFARFEPDVFGVETVLRVYGREGFGPNMAGHLLRAARQGGRIYQAGLDLGFVAEEIEAEVWRRWLVGSGQADNPAIAATVRLRVRRWPGAASNHEADGAGVALYVAERALLRARGLSV